MPLSTELQRTLKDAITSYNYPCVTFDFAVAREILHDSMPGVERAILSALRSDDLERVKDGLSNILCWGYARAGYRDYRVTRFRRKITPAKLSEAQQLFSRTPGPGVIEIKKLRMPEFSGMAFVSKIRMFLDPDHWVVLDRKLMKLRSTQPRTIFSVAPMPPHAVIVPITLAMVEFYESWYRLCVAIATEYFTPDGFRAVDIERGVFWLIESGQAEMAAIILAQA